MDIYRAVSFTENAALTQANPMRPILPCGLLECLLCVVSQDVLNVLIKEGVESIITSLIKTSVEIVSNDSTDEFDSNESDQAIRDGVVISTFGWMPDSWVISRQTVPPCHEVVHDEKEETIPTSDILGVLEPFIGLASRTLQVFELIDNALTNLHELAGSQVHEDYPISFSFINKEMKRFVSLAKENKEMEQVLFDLCNSLNSLTDGGNEKEKNDARKASIIDPGFVRVVGPKTTSTSAKVDCTATTPKTKMVSDFKRSEMSRYKPRGAPGRKNLCGVCNGAGHQARTCPNILLEVNRERADAFFKQLVLKGKVDAYMKCMAKRTLPEHMNNVADRIRKWQTT